MARFNEILVGRINRGLQKYLGLKGEAPAPQLASDIQPVFPLPLGAEYYYLDGWGLYAAEIAIGAVAAQNGEVRLRNPTKSGVIAVVEMVLANTTTGNTLMTWGPNNTDEANPLPTPGRFDARGSPKPTCLFSSGSSAGVVPANTLNVIFAGAGTHLLIGPGAAPERPLLPGDLMFLQDAVVNEACNFSVWWRERTIEDSETT